MIKILRWIKGLLFPKGKHFKQLMREEKEIDWIEYYRNNFIL